MKTEVVYHVDSPFTDVSNGKFYPFTTVQFTRVKEQVFTKTGLLANGAVKCLVRREGDHKVNRGQSVCHPIDKFRFWEGAKYALTRALNDDDGKCYTKELRVAIWDAFFVMFPKARK